MIVYTQGEYTVQYIGKELVPATFIVKGIEVNTSGLRGFKFSLFKHGVSVKTYTTTGRASEPAKEVIDSVIEVFKKYMV